MYQTKTNNNRVSKINIQKLEKLTKLNLNFFINSY